eukprot:m.216153 g.216153  ORF g.216153 m.216153 type:complete len:487 (+) comp19114_c0_seq10:209-1669(+)
MHAMHKLEILEQLNDDQACLVSEVIALQQRLRSVQMRVEGLQLQDRSTVAPNAIHIDTAGSACVSTDYVMTTAAQLKSALDEFGFAILAPDKLDLSAEMQKAVNFFQLAQTDDEVRAEATSTTDRARRGYSQAMTENFASLIGEYAQNDHVYKFRVGPQYQRDAVASGGKLYAKHFRPNCWPEEDKVPGFSVAMTRAYADLEQLADMCTILLNEAYRPEPSLPRGQPATSTSTAFDIHPHHAPAPAAPHTSILSVNWYQMPGAVYRERDAAADTRCCIHEHTDVSLFTLIAIEPSDDDTDTCKPGLEVRMPRNGSATLLQRCLCVASASLLCHLCVTSTLLLWCFDSIFPRTISCHCRDCVPIATKQRYSIICLRDGEFLRGHLLWWPVAGSWTKSCDIPLRRGQVILIVGDLFDDWTGGQVPATVHRVGLLSSHDASRLSLVYFASPAPDARVGYPGHGADAGQPGRSVSYDKWRKSRIKRAMKR